MKHTLTHREVVLLGLMANGLSIRDAAERMHIKDQTAKNMLHYIYSKLGVDNRWQAFVEMGWLKPPPEVGIIR